jgi:hypothetical protein
MEVLLNGFPSKNLSATNLTFRRIYWLYGICEESVIRG